MGGREEGRKGGREKGREGGREGGREEGREVTHCAPPVRACTGTQCTHVLPHMPHMYMYCTSRGRPASRALL